MSVLIETSFGDITIDLNISTCPNSTYNFLKLCKLKHYNNCLFMRVQKDYVTQIASGRPTTIWKQLDPSQPPHFKDEVDMQARLNEIGLVCTSNTGSNLNDSEFFITLTKAHLASLNGKHSIFGKVVEGVEVLRKINETYVDKDNRPQMNIRILHTIVLDDPYDDPNNLIEPQSPELIKTSDRLEASEHLEMLEKYQTEKDIVQATRKTKAKKQAITLQILGDIPDADIKPPENILFVCKLNPITQERDLEIIFSRFGPIKSVEIVRDWKTGQSLQYAFIEFESEKSCEQAYLKMENVVIDDRRIHVDFSQSVSKLAPKVKSQTISSFHQRKKPVEKADKQLAQRVKDRLKGSFGHRDYQIVAKDSKIVSQPQTDSLHNKFMHQSKQPSKKKNGSEEKINTYKRSSHRLDKSTKRHKSSKRQRSYSQSSSESSYDKHREKKKKHIRKRHRRQ